MGGDEMSLRLFIAASVVAFATACIYQWFWGYHLSHQNIAGSKGDSRDQRRFRDLALRVDLISPGASSEDLENDLKSIIAGSPGLQGQVDGLSVCSITPRDRTCLCASVTIRTQLPEGRLLAYLQQASQAKSYRYDCTFYGITPLYQDKGGAHYECALFLYNKLCPPVS